PAADKDSAANATVEVKVPAGAHVVKVANTGLDWFTVKRYVFAPYAPALGVLGKSGKDYAVLWVYNREADQTPPGARSAKTKIENRDGAGGGPSGGEIQGGVVGHAGGQAALRGYGLRHRQRPADPDDSGHRPRRGGHDHEVRRKGRRQTALSEEREGVGVQAPKPTPIRISDMKPSIRLV